MNSHFAIAVLSFFLLVAVNAKSSFSRAPSSGTTGDETTVSTPTRTTMTDDEEGDNTRTTTTDNEDGDNTRTTTTDDEDGDNTRTTATTGDRETTEGWSFSNVGSKLKCEACKMIAGWLKLSSAPHGTAALSTFLDTKCGSTLVVAGLCKELVRNQIEKMVPTDTDLCRRTIKAC